MIELIFHSIPFSYKVLYVLLKAENMIEVFDDLLDDETLSVLDRVVKDPLFACSTTTPEV